MRSHRDSGGPVESPLLSTQRNASNDMQSRCRSNHPQGQLGETRDMIKEQQLRVGNIAVRADHHHVASIREGTPGHGKERLWIEGVLKDVYREAEVVPSANFTESFFGIALADRRLCLIPLPGRRDQLRRRFETQRFPQLPSPRKVFEQGTGPRPELNDASGAKRAPKRDSGFVYAIGITLCPSCIGGRIDQAEIVSIAVHGVPVFRSQWGDMKAMSAPQTRSLLNGAVENCAIARHGEGWMGQRKPHRCAGPASRTNGFTQTVAPPPLLYSANGIWRKSPNAPRGLAYHTGEGSLLF